MEQSITTDLSSHQAGIAIVAVAAQFSFLATSFLILMLSYYRLRIWDPKSKHVICSEEFCVKFLRSQFAILFFDLLLSDWVQAIGFSLNFAHIGKHTINNSPVCATQGVLIQVGDTSGAFATFLIAVHTFIVLVIRSPPTTTVLLSLVATKWVVAIVLTLIGPLFFVTDVLGPFYAPAGGWCWISGSYSWARLYLHYIWLFVAGIASAVIYGLTFVTLRRRIRSHLRQQSSATTDRSTDMTSMENAARKMLVYPLCYLFLTLPLAIYRIAGISGHPWKLDAQLVCGSIFTLAGFVDAIVFCWTRNLFSAISRDRSRPSISSGSTSLGTATSAAAAAEKVSVSMEPYPEQKPAGFKSMIQGGSAHQFMPAKYSLATIDLNSFDEASP
ncbi:hypothetical protein CROQUDRAFT_97158 [Cronartium quercuum f. sp. fusiforme G11]|uniref:Glucose receptor Git3 N-terminal domain-containing protein n=1 Tax=Cronartium quercuum f. sp. fusiforme G11 TaxID=708437 RepID=A0A9P6NEZ1_9BASI|nr:hypothetical protein CROQUDRAFT_97158 [Cronartium quercuum f. sp. fusiforme G11]